jgi:hypothetical protein
MSILSVSAALAQPGRAPIEPSKAAASEQVREADVRQRRAALRETLKSQPDEAAKNGNGSIPVRQLTTQERAELRKQLRQQ